MLENVGDKMIERPLVKERERWEKTIVCKTEGCGVKQFSVDTMNVCCTCGMTSMQKNGTIDSAMQCRVRPYVMHCPLHLYRKF